ncbi:MAG: hypothetical protein K2Q15_11305 [Burkholderiales bacterium]|nr:hypothetical protein [Burkholderiales bacterium]MCX7207119.1 hypothetical protein [Pseudomonadota bacterium]
MKPSPDHNAKHQLIQLYPLPCNQAAHAAVYLSTLDGVSAQALSDAPCISVHYRLPECSLTQIENHLKQAGFHLDESILSKIKRALVHYCEDIACSNLEIPEHNIKSRDVYVKVWDNHPHGDHDETPEELRRYL